MVPQPPDFTDGLRASCGIRNALLAALVLDLFIAAAVVGLVGLL